jgi:hypothetical protein
MRDLQMSEARHHRFGVALGEIDELQLQRAHQQVDRVERIAQPQPNVGGHLVIARAAGVQALAGVAHQVGQPLLDVQMNVLEIDRPAKGSGIELRLDRLHTALDVGEVVGREHAYGRHHPCMRQRSADVDCSQPPIEGDRRGVLLGELVDRLAKAPRPGLRCQFVVLHSMGVSVTGLFVQGLFWHKLCSTLSIRSPYAAR